MHKISILAEEADNLQEKFDLAELDLNLKLDGSKDKALTEKVIDTKKLKEMINTLKKTMFELDSILNDLNYTNYKYKRQIESASRIILSTSRILETFKLRY